MKFPQLSLRDLFWLVLVVAICCGWLVDRVPLARMAHQAERLEWRVEKLEQVLGASGWVVEMESPSSSKESLSARHPDGSSFRFGRDGFDY